MKLSLQHFSVLKKGYSFFYADVAKLSGVSKGIIHYYFLNKDHLILSVLEKIYDDLFPEYEKFFKEEETFKGILKSYLKQALDLFKILKSIILSSRFWARAYQKKSIEEIVRQHF